MPAPKRRSRVGIKKIKLKKHITPDSCRMSQCTQYPRARGLCGNCASHLKLQGGCKLYEKFAAPNKMTKKVKLKKNKKGKYCIFFNCSHMRRSRGFCSKHYAQLSRRGIYKDYAL